ncbi:hypothetical protein [Alysiella filiformis]|uniref:Uncharacterized protein n=1 Tax=Alysiella filiformis DSM 16848 TaxID=1120981 RepID=A0A286EFX9_9NEIS|nr:hypothetical protein [Alysiella filiformis]QMT30498.1 hypothetical protein H3L97_06970 [Alysiella filiformis]UBQ56521.1 hypothetical protein JF568_01710 [Alysiella filiformis DSM 16848]SOD69739.1 hypothetical protein SAMN02746062_01814 [Alysiella filiformis DSM 16848]
MIAMPKIQHTPSFQSVQKPLRHCCLIVDGNAHRPDLFNPNTTFAHDDVLCEAMLPEIRTVAMMIAAMRHDFNQASPRIFADEADWFAARIVVLQVRTFHLDVKLCEMLHLANQRAAAFARLHGLAFQAAQIRPSLHAKRPNHVLLMECALGEKVSDNRCENSLALRPLLVKLM